MPYHYHLVNEELAVVLEGEPAVRLDGAEIRLAPGDVVAMPPGEGSAHQFLNRTDRAVRMILFSTMIPGDWVRYPDSGKEMVTIDGLERDPARGRLLFTGDRILSGEGGGPYFLDEPADEPLGEPPADPPEGDRRVVRTGTLEWVAFGAGAFRASRRAIGEAGGCRRLGCSLYRVDPGERPGPFHAHHVNEEAFVALRGRGTLRTPAGEIPVGPGDVIGCPPGPESAHQFLAGGDEPLEILAVSTMEEPEIVEYPDLGEVRVMAGSPPGGDVLARTIDLVARKRGGEAREVER